MDKPLLAWSDSDLLLVIDSVALPVETYETSVNAQNQTCEFKAVN